MKFDFDIPERIKSVAVVKAGTNHIASDSLGNFIRQRLADMPQCPDVVIARPASIVHVLVESVVIVVRKSSRNAKLFGPLHRCCYV